MQHFRAKANAAPQHFAQCALRARLLPSARTIVKTATPPVRPGVVLESPARLQIFGE
ncbi:putative uncharacterized protein [Xanthomonas citri pv. mangiferaeindicae LMG 941]|nr:putative uncharacterized protein [Xanthomonas citri pv. mangiferaeindicae LMG 941]